MRYPDNHKQEVRAKIVSAAASLLRREGLDGVSIPALMKTVGLTHGGFYVHFKNRDDLIAEAVAFAGDQTRNDVFAASGTVEELLRVYVSTDHVSHPEHGCVVAALGTEATRQSAEVRRAFARVTHGLLALVNDKVTDDGTDVPSDEALRLTSQMVGAVVLARLLAPSNKPLAERILKASQATASTRQSSAASRNRAARPQT